MRSYVLIVEYNLKSSSSLGFLVYLIVDGNWKILMLIFKYTYEETQQQNGATD